ncbi:hydrogenase subunit MbhD domain-containing protein [Kosmotoga pacifica]|uniref:Uncharacterized protein n=1 Tax=Kosmotoga pacifica TaxID=1330330 RepID=A0A0G2Z5F2_9BACT|nr:hydrogenase subunit MbhD domain-containing protein [Kosmotoga pacifica]AKI96797.1 hypothetical protein IX53_02025 [Kosmotoga pacifica]
MLFAVVAFSCLYLLAALAIISVKTNFKAVIWYGILGFFSSIVMLLLGAPDVALTQFTVGVTLVILVYIMAIRKQRRVRIGYISTPHMIYKRNEELNGLEWEIISRIQGLEGYHIEPFEFENIQKALEALKTGAVDIVCGGLTNESVEDLQFFVKIPYLETILFKIGDKEVDYLHLKSLRKTEEKIEAIPTRKTHYIFLLAEAAEDLKNFIISDLDELEASGELKKIVERYL